MEKTTFNNAIKIIEFAIENNVSVHKASVLLGYSNTYFKNIKARLLKSYKKGAVDKKDMLFFKKKYNEYRETVLKKIFQKENRSDFKFKPISENSTENDIKVNLNEKEGVVDYSVSRVSSDRQIRTVEDLVKMCEIDEKVWEVVEQKINKWDVTSWKNGIAETVENFQIKARLLKRKEVVRENMLGEIFLEMVKNYSPPKLNVTKKRGYGDDNLLEISIFDLHLGKLAWGGETGENYDVKIARTRFLDALTDLLNIADNFNYSRILFPIGSDFFNSDTIFNTTTQGTPQDEDLRWQKTFNIGTRLLVDGINILKQTGVDIDVIVIPGNHDFERSFYMGKFLEAWFNNDSQVTFNTGASPRKYYRFGKVLLGFTHGSEEKESSLPLIMANDYESKPHWSDTIYHEFHLGHIHRKRTVKYNIVDVRDKVIDENLGVVIRYLSSLTGTDEWHHKKGFVGVIKAADGFIWNGTKGLIAHINSNLTL